MISDKDRWNEYHKKGQAINAPSSYALAKEELFPRGSVICDLGGGTGSEALYFLKKGHKVIIIDISDHALNIAKEKAKNAGLSANLDVREIDYWKDKINLPDNSVDVVYARESLHYFPAKETGRLLVEVERILKPGGIAYITLKSPEDKAELEFLKSKSVEYEPGVYIRNDQLKSRFTIEQLNTILTNSGISGFTVNPYKEESLGGEVKLLNEIIINKPQLT